MMTDGTDERSAVRQRKADGRIAFFSDESALRRGEISLKRRVLEAAEEAAAGGIRTLFTGLVRGADSAAAEIFAEMRSRCRDVRIVRIATPENDGETDFPRGSFYRRPADLTLRVTGTAPDGLPLRDRFIADSCARLVFLTDLRIAEPDSRLMKLLDYALRTHPRSVCHRVTVLEPERDFRPFQHRLF